MDVNIETVPAYHIAYIRQTGPYGEGNRLAMETLKRIAGSNEMLSDESIILGIAQDDPANTRLECCRYDACIVIGDNSCIRGASLNYGTAPGGRYAVFTIDHTVEAMQRAWSEIFPELMILDYQIDYTRPIIERYAVNNVKRHKCEVCVPIY